MSYPPIFAKCFQNASVKNLLGTNPMKLFLFDEAPEGTPVPYATWQTISGRPYNHVNTQRPDMNYYRLQIDVFASTAAKAREIAQAIETAVELDAYVVSFNGEDRDKVTKAYRYSFDVAWHVKR